MPSNSYLTLFILRHGEAKGYANTDFDRPLTQTGQQQSSDKGNLLKQRLPVIDTILCSAALRTQETLTYLNLNLDQSHVCIKKELYLCESEELLMHINQIERGKTTLLIGHNPGLHQFTYELLPLCSSQQTLQEDAIASSFPTCALAELRFSYEDWSQINWHQGTLISYIK